MQLSTTLGLDKVLRADQERTAARGIFPRAAFVSERFACTPAERAADTGGRKKSRLPTTMR
jgi:hypothetical protein